MADTKKPLEQNDQQKLGNSILNNAKYSANRDYPLTNYSVEDTEDDDWD